MPEGENALTDHFRSAVSAVEASWQRLEVRPRRLSAKELAAYHGRVPTLGWRLQYQFSDGQLRRFDVLVSADFPFKPARVAVVDRPDFLTWPHVEKDGVLCLLPSHATVSVDDPYGGIVVLLDMALDLVEGLAAGGYDDEFRAEFLTYWGRATAAGSRKVLSLIEPAPPSRIVSIWEGRKRVVIAQDDQQLGAWLRNFDRGLASTKLRFHTGVPAWLDTVPVPADYPKTARQVYEIAARANAAELLEALAREVPSRLFVVLSGKTESGPAIAATVITRPTIVRGSDPLARGFRPLRVPESVFNARFFGSENSDRLSVERVDASWIHGRDDDPRIAKLRKASVAVLGCGSLGAPVAINLARAGVGELVLVDEKLFKGANVGRHPLGVGSVDLPKATELAQRIRADLPHVKVESYNSSVQDLLLRPDSPLMEVDLIISALGDWSAESMLDEWHLANGKCFPIVYGWTEPHAAAGHAVIVSTLGDRLRDGLNAVGQPHLVATQWVNDTRRYEPACGAAFEPYGPVELSFVTALVSQAALDSLLGPAGVATHRIWLARRAFVEDAGGAWTEAIRAIAPQSLAGGTTIERQWGANPSTKVLAA